MGNNENTICDSFANQQGSLDISNITYQRSAGRWISIVDERMGLNAFF